jgi:hypothetical protein
LGVLAACTATVTDNTTNKTPDGGSNTSSSGSTSGSGTSSSGGTSSGGTSSGAVGGCATTADQDACLKCCGITDAIDTLNAKAADDCACAGPCATDCASWCPTRGVNPPDACVTCLESDSTANACQAKVDEACAKVPDCKKVEDCALAAKCDAKPVPDAGK